MLVVVLVFFLEEREPEGGGIREPLLILTEPNHHSHSEEGREGKGGEEKGGETGDESVLIREISWPEA